MSDAFVVGEEWISEHYFTTDARSESFHSKVLERRKQWKDSEVGTTLSRFTAARGDLERGFTSLSPDVTSTPDLTATQDLVDRVVEVLGFRTGEFVLKGEGPLTWVSTPGLSADAPLVIVSSLPAASLDDALAKDVDTLLGPVTTDDGTMITSAARMLSALFVRDAAPRFALLLAGRWAVIAEQERWPEGRYLAIDLQLVAERNDTKVGGEVDRALTCLDAASLGPDADGDVWWSEVLEASVKHTVGVSKDLREGVRLSIEIIANDVVSRRAQQGLEPLPADQAQPLAVQSLRYLYRILFLLYAEASPELGVLPVGASEYEQGYSLDRLRELTLVELHEERSRAGTHIYASLERLFRLVDTGHGHASPAEETASGDSAGLVFNPLRADLFSPTATAHIDAVGLGNAALQSVLRHLLLSKETKGRDRGFISYVELGINQLGAVYEGLMSYTGFFAEEDLFEVAKNGDASKGSWVVPVTRADHLSPQDFVTAEDPITGERRAVRHRAGTFVFRLAGRERQQSASYYTPEVLTRFTVSQALEELLDQHGQRTSAEEILGLTVCEPALGSGAFAIEATRQLAIEYLKRRQEELGERIDPEAYPSELQKVKAHIALHQVHGVDLNATAVELAEVSLWLDTMVSGLQSPWFGLRLKRGNSLIGARRAVYSQAQLKDKSWLTSTPYDVPLTELAANIEAGQTLSATAGKVHHFLLPALGWGSATEVPKDVAALAPDAFAALKAWRVRARTKPTPKQIQRLVGLSERVERLWQLSLRRLRIAETESSRTIDLWGRETPPHLPAVSREQIEASLNDEDGAYRRLRLVMDLWCAMWFWPLTENTVKPPALDEWIDALEKILGVPAAASKRWMDSFGGINSTWSGLNAEESEDLIWAVAQPIAAVRAKYPWVGVGQRVSAQQGCFHWELDFAAAFSAGGFDLQVGNPPWVRPRTDTEALLAEGDPWWQLAVKPSEMEKSRARHVTLRLHGLVNYVLNETGDSVTTAALLSSQSVYPQLAGQPDFYRAFMVQTWRHSSSRGTAGLIHPETHFTDEKASALRGASYQRLKRHWQFINELRLFEIKDYKWFGVHVYGPIGAIQFTQAVILYHPDTVTRSLKHDGTGVEPGYKDAEGNWDVRPHRRRIQEVTSHTLQTWAAALDYQGDSRRTPMLYTVNSAAASAFDALSSQQKIRSLALQFSRGWDQSIDRKKGRFISAWGAAASWPETIVQGPHIRVANPFSAKPNETLLHQQDWTFYDTETIAQDELLITEFKPYGVKATYDKEYGTWPLEDHPSVRDHYRVSWRSMTASNVGERTLMPAIYPKGTAHVHAVMSAGASPLGNQGLVVAAGVLSSLISDFAIRSVPKSTISGATLERLPMVRLDDPLISSLTLRAMQLNCLTEAYSELWEDCWTEGFLSDKPVLKQHDLGHRGPRWCDAVPLRRAADRRNALVEIDALVALMLGVSIDDLCTIYRTQFAVLYGYDHHEYTYDVNGRLIPNSVLSVWRKKGDRITAEERTAVHPGSGVAYTYELPFGTLDREADMRKAYTEFERRLAVLEGRET